MPTALPTKPAKQDPYIERPNPLDQEFLIFMAGENATPDEIKRVGTAWRIALIDINALLPDELEPTPHHNALITAIAAGVTSAAIHQRGRVHTTKIQDATPEQLITWTDAYEDMLRKNFLQQLDLNETLIRMEAAATDRTQLHSSTEWLEQRNALLTLIQTFARQAGFLWECREVSGLNDALATVTGPKPKVRQS